MDENDITAMFNDIDDDTKKIIAKALRLELSKAILGINNALKQRNLSCKNITPPPALIMNAFRLCRSENISVVLLGQDPYTDGSAMGLSFSVPRCQPHLPPSLKNIYSCLLHNGLIKNIPAHGDLTNWARQGVLLLNTSLSTELGESNVHNKYWNEYMIALLNKLNDLQPLIFILLGVCARGAATCIDREKHTVLEWGHPSPLNSYNNHDNPKNFKYCNVFGRANDTLIRSNRAPINWDPDVANISFCPGTLYKKYYIYDDPPMTRRGQFNTYPNIWVFTDGACIGNGKKGCIASWAYYISSHDYSIRNSGMVERKCLRDEVYESSNNRGELTAIMCALTCLENTFSATNNSVIIVTDSMYCINALDVLVDKWLSNPETLCGKKNLDLILPMKKTLDRLRLRVDIKFQHTRGHLEEPDDKNDISWFIWRGNDMVDELCNYALIPFGRIVKK